MKATFVIPTDTFLRATEPGAVAELAPLERAIDFNSTREVVIDRGYKWNPDMASAPRNCKLQLLGAGGVAHYGIYFGDPFWVKWAPLPSN